MTIGFSTHFPEGKGILSGKPTEFVSKIWKCISDDNLDFDANEALNIALKISVQDNDRIHEVKPKRHTIRRDEKKLWKEGKNIHPVNHNRTPDRFQFAPTIICVSTEVIEIKWFHHVNSKVCRIYIGGKSFACYVTRKGFDPVITGNLKQLAENDGFETVEDFLAWFHEDFAGKLIHWTPLNYGIQLIDVKDWESVV